MTIARTESLSEDVKRFLAEKVGVDPKAEFPRKNATEHAHFSEYYSAQAEDIVYRMWKNAFDNGLYERYEGLALTGS